VVDSGAKFIHDIPHWNHLIQKYKDIVNTKEEEEGKKHMELALLFRCESLSCINSTK